ncbi:MAG: iron-containing alcohol dehydrogenase [Oscillospiraceae bacterium]|nr:iron-containing alcohol dehydrogenase [Oscillospiraceae bacterium]
MQFYMPTELITGPNCVEKNAEKLARYGKRCLIVTGGSVAKRSGALDDTEAALRSQGIEYSCFSGIAPNPTLASCQEGGRLAHEAGAEFVIGIGGGSPLDAAKAVGVFAANPDMTEEGFYSAVWPNAPLPIVLIGTTAGTGSEVTSVSVLTDSRGRKHSIHDRRVYAALALGDARYTMSLPRGATLSTGIDALAHCVESYFSKKADLFSRTFSVRGVKLGLPVLQQLAGSGDLPTPEQREALYQASILGGMAINPTGTVFPHNVGYYLTENYGIPHGFASAVFMPELLRHVRECEPQLSEAFYAACGTSEEALCRLVEKTVPVRGIQLTEDEIRTALPRWEHNGTVHNTVGTVRMEEIAAMLQKEF